MTVPRSIRDVARRLREEQLASEAAEAVKLGGLFSAPMRPLLPEPPAPPPLPTLAGLTKGHSVIGPARSTGAQGLRRAVKQRRANLPASDPARQDRQLVRELTEIESGLTDWEEQFVEDIADKVLGKGWMLTPKQREKAEQIWQEKA